jgi:hypothetical protein
MRVGQIIKLKGEPVKVVSVNDDNTVTVAHVAGSSKKGWAGKIALPKNITPTPNEVKLKLPPGTETATLTLEAYNNYSEPINRAAIAELNSLREKYFKQAQTNPELIGETLSNLRALCDVVSANFQDVIEGRCGIDECQMQYRGGMAPHHYASEGCQSGQQTHCTCDACF